MQDIHSSISFQSVKEIHNHQWVLLQKTLKYLERNSPFYQVFFQKHAIISQNIQSWEDFTAIPFTTKDDLQRCNDDFLCIPRNEIVDFCTTSGTLGAPVTFALSDADVDRLAYNEACSFACAGVKKGDVVQLMTTMDKRFMAGLAYFLGLRKLGASVVRAGAGVPELQWDSIFRYSPKYLVAVPSFLLKMIEYAENHNIDYNQSSVEGVICIGEAIRNNDFSPNVLSEKITQKWKVKLFSTYASTEMSTAFTECVAQNGGHLNPELIIAEVLDDEGNPVQKGGVGELVVTTLGVQAMPLLRFRTGDMLQVHHEPCACGRNTLRLGAVLGRKQQMVKYKGTTVYPPAIQEVLAVFPQILLHQTTVYQNEIGTDELIVRVAVHQPHEALLQEIKNRFKAQIRVTPQVVFEDIATLEKEVFPPMSRKPILFVDKRK